MISLRKPSAAEVLADHLAHCTQADAAIVVDGSADELLAEMLAAGWTWDGTAEYMLGKRVRYLTPPAGMLDREIEQQLAELTRRRREAGRRQH
jgi:hypothetical protein